MGYLPSPSPTPPNPLEGRPHRAFRSSSRVRQEPPAPTRRAAEQYHDPIESPVTLTLHLDGLPLAKAIRALAMRTIRDLALTSGYHVLTETWSTITVTGGVPVGCVLVHAPWGPVAVPILDGQRASAIIIAEATLTLPIPAEHLN